MSEQLDMVYDYMIARGKKLKGHRLKMRDRLDYLDNSIAHIHIELSSKKGAISSFCRYLVDNEVYKDIRIAQDALRLYSQTNGDKRTHEKRIKIIELYNAWEFCPISRDVEKWNRKLQEVWEQTK